MHRVKFCLLALMESWCSTAPQSVALGDSGSWRLALGESQLQDAPPKKTVK